MRCCGRCGVSHRKDPGLYFLADDEGNSTPAISTAFAGVRDHPQGGVIVYSRNRDECGPGRRAVAIPVSRGECVCSSGGIS